MAWIYGTHTKKWVNMILICEKKKKKKRSDKTNEMAAAKWAYFCIAYECQITTLLRKLDMFTFIFVFIVESIDKLSSYRLTVYFHSIPKNGKPNFNRNPSRSVKPRKMEPQNVIWVFFLLENEWAEPNRSTERRPNWLNMYDLKIAC